MDNPHRDKDTFAAVYFDRTNTLHDLAEHFDVSLMTVHRWIDEHDLPRREPNHARMRTTQDKGYETWYNSGKRVYVHRLLAVAKCGYNAVVNKRIHHKNGIPWDNRPENVEPLTRKEHQGRHKKATGLERKAIAYAYEMTDMSSYEIAKGCNYSPVSVMRIHKEYF